MTCWLICLRAAFYFQRSQSAVHECVDRGPVCVCTPGVFHVRKASLWSRRQRSVSRALLAQWYVEWTRGVWTRVFVVERVWRRYTAPSASLRVITTPPMDDTLISRHFLGMTTLQPLAWPLCHKCPVSDILDMLQSFCETNTNWRE